MKMNANPMAEGIIREGIIKLENLDFNNKFWSKDPTLWKKDPEHQELIKNFLGWQKVYDWTLERIEDVLNFAQEAKKDYKYCVVMGMGGSSLAPEVFRTLFGKQPGYPELFVLDSTNPDWVADVRSKINPAETLFIFASKSGGTVEPSSQFAYFFEEVKKAGVKNAGSMSFLENTSVFPSLPASFSAQASSSSVWRQSWKISPSPPHFSIFSCTVLRSTPTFPPVSVHC